MQWVKCQRQDIWKNTICCNHHFRKVLILTLPIIKRCISGYIPRNGFITREWRHCLKWGCIGIAIVLALKICPREIFQASWNILLIWLNQYQCSVRVHYSTTSCLKCSVHSYSVNATSLLVLFSASAVIRFPWWANEQMSKWANAFLVKTGFSQLWHKPLSC